MSKKDNKKKISVSNIVVVIIFILGLSLMLYPTVSDKWNSYHASKAISNYQDSVSNLSQEEYDRILEEAEQYNLKIARHPLDSELTAEQWEEYENVLDITGTGIMGYIEIPSINVKLPIYHGTSDAVLETSAGHVEWSALPIGGDSTHSVISGHRGLPSAKLFTDLDKVNIGDTIKITVLNETYTYEVDKVTVVLPDETSSLQRVIGKDYLTVFTCTPYGINTHRLLVRAHRVENAVEEARVTAEADVISFTAVALVIFFAIIIILFIVYMTADTIRNKRKKETK